MTKSVDWIVVGAGITGAALAYELVRQGFSVLRLEQHATLQGSSRYGYGGIAYWAGTTDLTRQLCDEARAMHPLLSDELEGDTQFRELDLVLTIAANTDPLAIAQSYATVAVPPRLVSVEEACDLEPLLNPAAISGALTVKHGHLHLGKTIDAYTEAFTRLGGQVQIGQVTGLLQSAGKVTGVTCEQESFFGVNVVVCAGAMSRELLKSAGISVQQYFTHAELIETPPVDITLRSLVMPADAQRFKLEATSSTVELDSLWDEPGHEPMPPILDAGAIQLLDGTLRIGQVSRTLTDPNAAIDAIASEQAMRTQVGAILPALQDLPGTWHHCLIAFSRDSLPLVGSIAEVENVHLFSGFSNPLAIVPPLARRFAQAAAIALTEDPLLDQLSPNRFS
ncbi:MAG: FAD-dependent oxidoreductase [Leptolyngbya sp.]|nr:MAG: FAD-dependent oxidoreductase [Leptolyngbya sp.]